MSAEPIEQVVSRAVAAAGEGRVLLLGNVPLDRAGEAAGRCDRARAEDLLAAPANDAPRYELAVLVGVLEHLSADDGARLIGTLRDLRTSRMLVAVPAAGERWRLDDMLGFGLEAAGGAGGEDGPLALYVFDIDRYKRTPDWLNARNWANPELWGRHRW